MKRKLAILLCIFCSSVYSQDRAITDSSDLLSMSLEDLLKVKVEVASLFNESELEIGNTVDLITEEDWKKTSSKNLLQAINHLPSILPLTNVWGGAIPIRGYSNNLSVRGVSFLVDGVPLNNLADMTANYDSHFFDLGALSRIEIVRGPGSSIYGSDAFHGVFSLQTYSNNVDETTVDMGAGGDGYNKVSLKNSVGLGDKHRLNTSVGYTNQGDQNLVYEYNDPSDDIEKTADRENSYKTLTAIVKIKSEYRNRIRSNIGAYYSEYMSKQFPGAIRGLVNGSSLGRDNDNSNNDTSARIIRAEVERDLESGIDISLMGYFMNTRAKRLANLRNLNGTYENNFKNEDTSGLDITIKQDNKDINTKWLLRAQYKDAHLKDDYSDRYNTDNKFLLKDVANADDYERITKSIVAQGKTSFLNNSYHILYGGRLDEYSDLGSHTTPRVGFIFQPTTLSSIKLNYGQAFRAGSPNELLGTDLVGKNSDLEPETIDSYELSYIRHSKKTRSVVTVFTNKWKEAIQVKDEIYQNSGENSSKGIEVSFNSKFNYYSFDFNASYVTSKNDTDDIDYVAFPKYLINLGAGYDLESYYLKFYLSNRIHLQTYSGPETDLVTDPQKLSTYFRTDLHVEWTKFRDMNIWMNFNNLASRDNSVPSLWNVEHGIPDDPFSASLGVTILM